MLVPQERRLLSRHNLCLGNVHQIAPSAPTVQVLIKARPAGGTILLLPLCPFSLSSPSAGLTLPLGSEMKIRNGTVISHRHTHWDSRRSLSLAFPDHHAWPLPACLLLRQFRGHLLAWKILFLLSCWFLSPGDHEHLACPDLCLQLWGGGVQLHKEVKIGTSPAP